MSMYEYTDDKLNMFIDEQLDTSEMQLIHSTMLADGDVRERVCQLKAVRELVGFTYSNTPRPSHERRTHEESGKSMWKGIAASVIMGLGVALGWSAHKLDLGAENSTPKIITAQKIFHYFSQQQIAGTDERKIVLHISTGDIRAVRAALDEADLLLASYKGSNVPMQIDVVANKEGINVLRADVSPYVERIEQMMADNDNISFYACQRSIAMVAKAERRSAESMNFIRNTLIDKAARELIPERLKLGWVYVKV